MTSLSPMPDFVARVTPLLRAATRVWMFMHTSPDPDAVGSQVAVAWWIRQLNPACAIQIGGADRPIDALLGVAAAVDPTWYCHVDPADVIYLTGDVVVLVDVAELVRTSRKGGATLPADVPLVVIDHHVVAPTTPYQYVDTRYQSAAALVYDMLACAGVPLTRAVHAAIVMGVLGDSGYFRYFDARIEATLQLVQRFCADYGASAYYELVDELERNRPVAHVILQGAYLRNLVVSDTYAYTTLSLAEVVGSICPQRPFNRSTPPS